MAAPQYKRDARALRSALTDALRHLLTVSPLTAAPALAPTGGEGLAWGDLDPEML